MRRRKIRSRNLKPLVPDRKSDSRMPGADIPEHKRRKWLFRAGAVFLVPALVLVLEGALRLLGWGYPASFFVKSGPGELTTNEKFACQFYGRNTPLKPFLFRLQQRKPERTFRICILGESAAMGTPDPAFGFGRILETILHHQFPNQRFEVINAAMRGIDSYVVRGIVRECSSCEIDAFILYMGNNEVIGLHGPDPSLPRWVQSPNFIAARHWVLSTRAGQLLGRALGKIGGPDERKKQDMAYFRRHCLADDDPRREQVRNAFQANVHAICQSATRNGSTLILCTVPVNLRDCPPLGSVHRSGLSAAEKAAWDSVFAKAVESQAEGKFAEAIQLFLTASGIDKCFAELDFRLARCFLATNGVAQAKEYFSRARDRDALQFRMDSKLNDIIRAEAERLRAGGVLLWDAEKAFSDARWSDNGIPDEDLFLDHVHPTFKGNYLVATELARSLEQAFQKRLGHPALTPFPTQRECAAELPYTLYDELNVRAAMVRMLSGPPFLDQLDHAQRQAAAEEKIRRQLAEFNLNDAETCIKTYRAAINRGPDYWPTRFNYGSLCAELGRHAPASEQFSRLVAAFPHEKRFRLALANSLLKTGDRSGAAAQFQAALETDWEDEDLRKTVHQLQQN